MKGSESDFLTHKQRVKFVAAVFPLTSVFIIPAIALTATNKLWVVCICLCIPIIGISSLKLGIYFGKQRLFKTASSSLNAINMFLICWLAGPTSPSFIIGIMVIGANILSSTNRNDLILTIIGFISFISWGSYLAGKSFSDLFIILMILLTYTMILLRLLQFTLLQGREIGMQKQLIEEKNKDITDSINYAKRIQQAKLPDKKEIYASLSNSFVLFKPKDIVSGDFYYFQKKDRSVFIAAADCTGHGVPGAFMSMIGSEKLDDALAHTGETSEILKHLNKGIKSSLRQTDSNESTRDGMDIALCAVNTVDRIVKYAGANRPLWIIRKGQAVVEEIKATKKAIGGFTEDGQLFHSHEIKFQEGDTFYIATDGYADTFGGPENKKITTKRFKEILLSIQDRSMQDQEHELNNFLENWKVATEQVDDILVIGVRLL